MSSRQDRGLAPAIACIALGLAVAGYFVSQTLFNARTGVNTAEVKGLAERRVSADRANWQIRYTVTGSDASDMATLYARSESERD
ncbi:MAG: hypothetical protein AAFX10_10700, partial [Pseudomonadota bacterium]